MRAFLDTFRLALGTFRAHPLRSLLTLLGIVIGVTTVVTLMALLQGLRDDMNEKLSLLGADSFQVTKRPVGFTMVDQEEIARRPNLTLADRDAIVARCPAVRAAAGEDFSPGEVVRTAERSTAPGVMVWAVTYDYLETNGVTIDRGRSFSMTEDLDGAQVAILGADLVDRLFGDLDPLGQAVRIRDRQFRVVGSLRRRGSPLGGGSQDNDVVVPLRAFHDLFGHKRSIDISIAATSPADLTRAQDEVRQLLRQRRGVKADRPDNFGMFSNDSMTKMFNELSSIVTSASFFVCLLSLVVGGIGILNIMLVSVTERTREIGIRKALGAKRRLILSQFAVEAIVLAAAGGALGVLLGFGFAWLVEWTLSFPTRVPPWAVATSLLMSSLTGLAFGVYPAIRAARLDPVEAMRAEVS